MIRRIIAVFVAAVSLSLPLNAAGQNDQRPAAGQASNPFGRVYPPRIYNTVKLAGTPPVIDGRLDDDAWKEGQWAGDYIQQIPTEGAKPSQPTEIKILYDEKNVYVAIRAYDDPKLIHNYGSRRDKVEDVGDIVGVCFDSYNDKRTGFEFDLTAGGGKTDLLLANDGWDTTWDAVWHGKTAMEENAWTAEFQIPLNQLRYGPQGEQVWGLHAWRWIDRNQEEDQWNLIPRQSTGRMYNLGELHGIRGLRRIRHVELLPHVVSKLTSDPKVQGDPYRNGVQGDASVGLDAKIGLTSNFTLDATVNPDFGQVEADPSVMNLTAYETFYPEKRPFFLEGKNIMKFDVGGEDGGGDMLFYSRRIGAAPAHSPRLAAGEFMRLPEATSILDAVKITGKTDGGLSLGILQSLTSRETAEISRQGVESRSAVEPSSNYFLSVIGKDWDKGNTSLGGMFTSTHRWISDPELGFLPTDALTGGVDFARYFENRTYVLQGKTVFSQVTGSRQAISDLQTNAVHYYQRPDAAHLKLNPNATSLAGHGGQLLFGKTEKGRWRFSNTFEWRSPGLDLNDIGYLRQADSANNQVAVGYRESAPKSIFRSFGFELHRIDSWDFGGLKTEGMTGFGGDATFTNKWHAHGAMHLVGTDVGTRLLRGGPAVARDRFFCWSVGGGSDPSRRVAVQAGVHRHLFEQRRSSLTELYPGLTLKLSDSLMIVSELQYSHNINDLEYVATPASGASSLYILGRIDQKTLGTTFRVNLTLTPDLSVQYYGSPFISTGRYAGFKRTTSPLAENYMDRFRSVPAPEITYHPETNIYDVVETAGLEYSFNRPDFSFREFRSNLVMRWEPKPGSSLYVVWSQGRTSASNLWDGSLSDNYSALWNAPSQNVFLVKLSYWLPWE
ncbi:MAG: hydrolase [Acidobacteria bacterium]|nr:MAG: hydrolase [Acidobacteriota bacterium]